MARRVFTRPGKKIDFKQWDAIPSLSTEVSTDVTTLGGAISFAIPATILRARGYVQAIFDETQQAGDEIIFTAGLGIITTDNFDGGVTGVPDPAGEPEFPWLWWGQIKLEAFAAAAENVWALSLGREHFGYPMVSGVATESLIMSRSKP